MSQTKAEQIAGPLPAAWQIVKPEIVQHPSNKGVKGILVKHRDTGIYRLAAAGALSSIEQRKARGVDNG